MIILSKLIVGIAVLVLIFVPLILISEMITNYNECYRKNMYDYNNKIFKCDILNREYDYNKLPCCEKEPYEDVYLKLNRKYFDIFWIYIGVLISLLIGSFIFYVYYIKRLYMFKYFSTPENLTNTVVPIRNGVQSS